MEKEKENLDATQSLLTDIISWEKDLSEYASLESILRERYEIHKREVKLKPLSELTDEQCIAICRVAEELPFCGTAKWEVVRNEHYISVESKRNNYSFMIDPKDGDIAVYFYDDLKTTDNMAQIIKWYSDNNFDVFPNKK